MNSRICVLLLVLTLFALPAHAEEGSPLLSVDVLLSLEESYEVFLEQLGDLAVERGLLSEDERAAWHDAQMGDFYQNGGYGSILVNYMPGALDYPRGGDAAHPVRQAGRRHAGADDHAPLYAKGQYAFGLDADAVDDR